MTAARAQPRVYVPYPEQVPLNPWVERVLASYNLNLVFVRLGNDDAYRQLLHTIWAEQHTVVIIEHDIVPWYGAIEELHGCLGLWCSCSYRYQGGYGLYHGLGCTKLSAELMRLTPHVWDEPGHWSTLDQRLFFAAREVAQEPHHHRPPVLHLSEKEYAMEGRP